MKPFSFGLALASLAAYGGLAFRVYVFQVDPERPGPWSGAAAWILGPSGGALANTAESRIEDAIGALYGETGTPAERVALYRQQLLRAGDLLVKALRARPADPRALARLAAVRWELDAPFPGGPAPGPAEMISLASRTAPDAPSVQLLLGELLLRMGERDGAAEHFRRSVELDPSLASQVVQEMRDSLYPALEILGCLPRTTPVLSALQQTFFDEGQQSRYLEVLEETLRKGQVDLVTAYGNACLAARDPERLLDTLASLPPPKEPQDDSERLLQRSRALLARGDAADAAEDARRALALRPDEPRILEHLGRASLAAGDADFAVSAYREALGHVARGAAAPGWRARLYREIGEAEERRGRGDRAYDAYRKALELDPEDPYAVKRLSAMGKAAGLLEAPLPGAGP